MAPSSVLYIKCAYDSLFHTKNICATVMELFFDSNLQYDDNIHNITCHGRVDQVLHIENAGLLDVFLTDDEESLASSARTSPDNAAASW